MPSRLETRRATDQLGATLLCVFADTLRLAVKGGVCYFEVLNAVIPLACRLW